MKLNLHVLTLVILLSSMGCKKDPSQKLEKVEFVPMDVLVKVDDYSSTTEMFSFINNFDHSIKKISSLVYHSTLPEDSLDTLLDDLNALSFTNDENWKVTGYYNYEIEKINVFPKLFDMKDTINQQQWVQILDSLQLKKIKGGIIHFQVPEGSEKMWVQHFLKFPLVEWAELNYRRNVQLHSVL